MEQISKSISKLNGFQRWDYRFHQKKFNELDEKLSKSPYPVYSLNDVTSQVIDGTHFTPEYTDSSGVLFLMARNVRPFEVNLDEVTYISKSEHQKIIRCKPQTGDVIVTKDGTIGVAAVVPEGLPEFNIFVSLIKIRPKSLIAPHYLAAFLNSELGQLQIQQQIKGASITHIHLEDIRRLRIPLPSPDIQERIARELQDAYKARREKLIEIDKLFDELDKTVTGELGLKLEDLSRDKIYSRSISKLARWDITYSLPYYMDLEEMVASSRFPSKPLGEVVNISKDTINPKDKPDEYITYVEIGDVDARFAEVVSPQQIQGKDAPSRARKLVKTGDIVTAVSGALTGTKKQSTFIVPESLNHAVVSTGFAVIRSTENMLPGYILALLCSDFFLKMIWRRKTGAAIPAISDEEFRNIPVPIPPNEIQVKITAALLSSREKTKRLQIDAESMITIAKERVERMLLGDATG